MYLVGKIAFHEANSLRVQHPFFAPTILDGGVTRFDTGVVAQQVAQGLHDELATELWAHAHGSAASPAVVDFTFLAGSQHAADTQAAIGRVAKR